MKLRLAILLIPLVVLTGLLLALWISQSSNRSSSLIQPVSASAEAASTRQLRDAGGPQESATPGQHREQVEHRAGSTDEPRRAPLGPPASLSVLVVAVEGPGVYARVTLRSPSGRIRSALCGPFGWCSFDELESGVAWSVEVTDPEFLKTQRFDPLTLEAGESRRVALALWCSATPLRGHVVDEFGGRVAGHEVRMAWRLELPEQPYRVSERSRGEMSDQAQGIFSVHTDANGNFEFELVPAGGWWIWPVGGRELLDGEYLSVGVAITHGREEAAPEHVLVLHRGLRLSGRVLSPDGSPAPGVLMEAKGIEGLTWQRSALSDEQGEFEIVGLPEGEYSLSVEEWIDRGASFREPKIHTVADALQWGAAEPNELRVLAGTGGHVIVWHGAPEKAEPGAGDRLLEDRRSR